MRLPYVHCTGPRYFKPTLFVYLSFPLSISLLEIGGNTGKRQGDHLNKQVCYASGVSAWANGHSDAAQGARGESGQLLAFPVLEMGMGLAPGSPGTPPQTPPNTHPNPSAQHLRRKTLRYHMFEELCSHPHLFLLMTILNPLTRTIGIPAPRHSRPQLTVVCLKKKMMAWSG